MTQIEDAVWCGNAYQDEVPLELASTPKCNSIGSTLLIDPNKAWSGSYCASCTDVLLKAGWTESTPA